MRATSVGAMEGDDDEFNALYDIPDAPSAQVASANATAAAAHGALAVAELPSVHQE